MRKKHTHLPGPPRDEGMKLYMVMMGIHSLIPMLRANQAINQLLVGVLLAIFVRSSIKVTNSQLALLGEGMYLDVPGS